MGFCKVDASNRVTLGKRKLTWNSITFRNFGIIHQSAGLTFPGPVPGQFLDGGGGFDTQEEINLLAVLVGVGGCTLIARPVDDFVLDFFGGVVDGCC